MGTIPLSLTLLLCFAPNYTKLRTFCVTAADTRWRLCSRRHVDHVRAVRVRTEPLSGGNHRRLAAAPAPCRCPVVERARGARARPDADRVPSCHAYVLEEEECRATIIFYVSVLNESVGNRSKSDEGDTSKCHEERSSVVRERGVVLLWLPPRPHPRALFAA